MKRTFWRSHHCGQLTEKDIDQPVELSGWVDTARDHGGILFIDLRDRYGKTQLVLDPKKIEGDHAVKTEETIQVKGVVKRRPKGTENAKIPTGQVEVHVQACRILGACQTPPFEIGKSLETNEELRLQYRYLDLRNPAVQKNLFLRHKICQAMRRVLDGENFIEVETPILTKSTPEGARDYLVPSRLNHGEFYALPQSPQIFKQILMVAGFDRYFQIAKCFRDEDLRADRQPEFTQLDMEMAFINEDDIFRVVESVLKGIFKDVLGKELVTPFPKLTYQDAMARYGTDKPDLRFGLELVDVSDIFANTEFKVFASALAQKDGAVLALRVPNAGASRKDIDDLTEFAKSEGAGGLAYFKIEGPAIVSPIEKFFKSGELGAVRQRTQAQAGDLVLFAADARPKAQKILGAVRLYASRWKKLAAPDTFHFSWITDFPLFKWNEEDKRWDSEHHPFTSPNMQDWDKYKAKGELEKIRSSAYDLVLNGNELASGSVRIHSRDLQREIFGLIGLEEKEAERRFGFLLKAFEYGPPPHGGIALGLDRMAALFSGQSSIREVIAFPKNQKAVDPMTDAPSPVDERQMKDLGIKLR